MPADRKKEDNIDYGAGIYLNKSYGEYTNRNDIIAKVYSSDVFKAQEAAFMMQNAVFISEQKPPDRNMIKGIIN